MYLERMNTSVEMSADARAAVEEHCGAAKLARAAPAALAAVLFTGVQSPVLRALQELRLTVTCGGKELLVTRGGALGSSQPLHVLQSSRFIGTFR